MIVIKVVLSILTKTCNIRSTTHWGQKFPHETRDLFGLHVGALYRARKWHGRPWVPVSPVPVHNNDRVHCIQFPDLECPRPPRVPGAVWKYDNRHSVNYSCLRGYRHTDGDMKKTCDTERKEWLPRKLPVCSGMGETRRDNRYSCISLSSIAFGRLLITIMLKLGISLDT